MDFWLVNLQDRDVLLALATLHSVRAAKVGFLAMGV